MREGQGKIVEERHIVEAFYQESHRGWETGLCQGVIAFEEGNGYTEKKGT
ncbi:MAG: hypothetical protein K2H40_00185 [Lachnospiraceae bacterium]|nr:hypothetical protein [Lachnospiraceae bacterium]